MVDRENMMTGSSQKGCDTNAGFGIWLFAWLICSGFTPALVRLMYLSLSVTILPPEGSC